nr:integrase, catalytic region, zinc finger, CCHC-type, peptidase aspartic, catalytic [Tanacetum cinerariifolium]
TRSRTIEQTTSLLANNADLKAQIQEKVFAIAVLKNDLRKLKGNSVDTKFAKTSVLGKPVLQPLRNQSVVRQPNAFKHERPPISNDMVHNHNLDEAKKKTQERDRNSKPSLVEIVLFIVDPGCSKHMTGNLKLLINFMEKFLGMVKFRNDQIAPILGYGDLVQGAITIKRVYYVEGLNHNLFSVGQLCDADLEVAFRKSTCFIRDLKGNNLLSVIPRHEKTPYHIINDRKPSVKFFHIFGSVCYIVRDGENLDKMKEKGDECIFVGYSNQSKAYRVFNTRTRVIMESIHVNFYELPLMAPDQNSYDPAPEYQNSSDLALECQTMASDQNSSDPAPECQTMALNHDSLSPANQRQANVTQADMTVTTSNELDLLFSPMFDELLNGSSKVVSKSSSVSAANAPNQHQRQNHTTPLNNHTTPAPTCQIPTLAPTVISSENINQA